MFCSYLKPYISCIDSQILAKCTHVISNSLAFKKFSAKKSLCAGKHIVSNRFLLLLHTKCYSCKQTECKWNSYYECYLCIIIFPFLYYAIIAQMINKMLFDSVGGCNYCFIQLQNTELFSLELCHHLSSSDTC